jgi:hypothetical protein
MGILTPQQITALEASQAVLVTEAGKAQTVLNALYEADPEHSAVNHSAWRPLWKLYDALKTAIVEARRTVISNDDAFGEWKF